MTFFAQLFDASTLAGLGIATILLLATRTTIARRARSAKLRTHHVTPTPIEAAAFAHYKTINKAWERYCDTTTPGTYQRGDRRRAAPRSHHPRPLEAA